MPLQLYNTLTRKKELFKPHKSKHVGIYTCGPTVYDYAHIGNLSAYIMADLLRRLLEYRGYKVKHIKNITDVGHLPEDGGLDKIEYRAIKEKKTPQNIAHFFEAAFFEDEKKLNIKPAYKFPRATEHAKEMIALIEKLLKKGYAYKTKSGVYFDVLKFKDYGKLSKNTLAQLKAGTRVDVREEKKNPFDFALWIFDPKHLMQFESPFGRGYPGWHIECSAMATKYLGTPIDIHTGGEDNIFPHHESEIAQSECALNTKFVQYWMHKRHLLVDNQKMSKSLGNFYTLADLEKRGFSPIVFRYLVLSAHYRTKQNFTWKAMRGAKQALNKIYEFLEKLKAQSSPEQNRDTDRNLEKLKVTAQSVKLIKTLLTNLKQNIESALDDDLNTPQAFAAIFEFIGEINPIISRKKLDPKSAKEIYKTFAKFDGILGLNLTNPPIVKISPERKKIILKLINERDIARKNKDFARADKIREELNKMGAEIKDTDTETEWKIKS